MHLIFLVIDFLLFLNHTGGDIQCPIHGRLKCSVGGGGALIFLGCPDWLGRLRRGRMAQRMRSDWLEGGLGARSYPHVYSEIFISVLLVVKILVL